MMTCEKPSECSWKVELKDNAQHPWAFWKSLVLASVWHKLSFHSRTKKKRERERRRRKNVKEGGKKAEKEKEKEMMPRRQLWAGHPLAGISTHLTWDAFSVECLAHAPWAVSCPAPSRHPYIVWLATTTQGEHGNEDQHTILAPNS